MTSISITVNAVTHELEVPPRMLLADLLRERLGLTGTKVACGVGACGACTVHLDEEPIRSCLVFAVQADGRAVRTIEDIASAGELHPLQDALSRHHGLQCGYCTPGIVMALSDSVDAGEIQDADAARAALVGNICRCTGYEGVVDAIVDAGTR